MARDQYDVNAEVKLRPVTAAREISSDSLRVVTVRDAADNAADIRTTDRHPFWVVGRGWTPAESLVPGDHLKDARDKTDVTVLATRQELHSDGVPVYNIEVAEDHTYFVSDAEGDAPFAVWVHNACFVQSFRDPTGRIRQVLAIVSLNADNLLDSGIKVTRSARDSIRLVKDALDDAGHLAGGRFGAGVVDNIVAQNRSVNRGLYNKFEKKIADYMMEHIVEAMFDIRPKYSGKSGQPTAIEYIVEFSDGEKWATEFPNPLN